MGSSVESLPQLLPDIVLDEYKQHSAGQRISTSSVIFTALEAQYPDWTLSVCLTDACDLLEFSNAGLAEAKMIDPASNRVIKTVSNIGRYMFNWDGSEQSLKTSINFGRYSYRWKEHDFLVYTINGAEGPESCLTAYSYILYKPEEGTRAQIDGETTSPADKLIATVATWMLDVHDEVFMYDNGRWSKSKELWRSVQNASWDDVILEEGTKESLIHDVGSFFDGQKMYEDFRVPWKRGLILYGPPGNGKTMSIRALMNSLMKRPKPIPTLYVKSFTVREFISQVAIRQIFDKARKVAPCLMLFEDLDSLVTDKVRSFFLNEVDGLEKNEGIMMIGTTNHLDKLDPALAKRPSRFDRKYAFVNPSKASRVRYCDQWRQLLSTNQAIEFPDELCEAIANVTADFSFAYLKEAFVATLLATAYRHGKYSRSEEKGPLESLPFWKEMQKHIEALRTEMEVSEKEDTPKANEKEQKVVMGQRAVTMSQRAVPAVFRVSS